MKNKESKKHTEKQREKASNLVLWLQISSKPWIRLWDEEANVGLTSISMKSALKSLPKP